MAQANHISNLKHNPSTHAKQQSHSVKCDDHAIRLVSEGKGSELKTNKLFDGQEKKVNRISMRTYHRRQSTMVRAWHTHGQLAAHAQPTNNLDLD